MAKRVRFETRDGVVSFTTKKKKRESAEEKRARFQARRAKKAPWRKLEIRLDRPVEGYRAGQALSEHQSPASALRAWRKAFNRVSTSAYIADFDTGEDVTLKVSAFVEPEVDREVAG